MRRATTVLVALICLASCGGGGSGRSEPTAPLPSSPPPAPPVDPASAAVASATQWMNEWMDRDHNRFVVYEDVSAPGNHFLVPAKIPNEFVDIGFNGSSDDNPRSGATAIRIDYSAGVTGGFYLQNGILSDGSLVPEPNFGSVPNAGIDLSGATRITFWARGATGGELIDFFVAGVGRDEDSGLPNQAFPGSSPRFPERGNQFSLSTIWQQFEIDVSGLDLSYVLGGFGFFASSGSDGLTFFLDDIEFEFSPEAQSARLDEIRMIKSFRTLDIQPDLTDGDSDNDIDLALRNLAFTYDNALVILMYLSLDSVDGLRRARIIGDALVRFSLNDRTFSDGSLRSAYGASQSSLPPGWVTNGRMMTAPIPGFFTEASQMFFEVGQESVDVGNNAWAMIALTALYEATSDQSYLDAAVRLAEFIETQRQDTGPLQGFLGGINNPDSSSPDRRLFASVEHNIDLVAGFRSLARATDDPRWENSARHADEFVSALFDPSINCFRAGTIVPEGGSVEMAEPNMIDGQLPLDVQVWSLLAGVTSAIEQADVVIDCTNRFHRLVDQGIEGFDFNEDMDGVWIEGTGHAGTTLHFFGDASDRDLFLSELRAAQDGEFGDEGGLVASTVDGLTTGFGFRFFRRTHIAATAWFVFAQLGYNPFTQERAD